MLRASGLLVWSVRGLGVGDLEACSPGEVGRLLSAPPSALPPCAACRLLRPVTSCLGATGPWQESRPLTSRRGADEHMGTVAGVASVGGRSYLIAEPEGAVGPPSTAAWSAAPRNLTQRPGVSSTVSSGPFPAHRPGGRHVAVLRSCPAPLPAGEYVCATVQAPSPPRLSVEGGW